jgi:hypothetical protein
VSFATRGVVASAAVLALSYAALTACSAGPVEIDAPDLADADAAACERFVDDLPETLAGEDRRETSGDTAYGAAWGDPAIVVTCGVDEPADFDDTATCVQVDSAGWFVPDDVLEAASNGDQDVDVTATELNHRPRVELRLPADYRPDGFTNATGALTKLIERDLEKTSRCK